MGSYERETRTFEEWEAEANAARGDFRSAAMLMVKVEASESLPDYTKRSAIEQWESHALRAAARLSKALRRSTVGVVTRRGYHVRYEAMRHGHQSDELGEHSMTWCVLDVGPDIVDLPSLEKKLAFDVSVEFGVKPEDLERMEFDAMDRLIRDAKAEVRERLTQHVVNACRKRYGWEPYAHSVLADYSPTGKWFSHVYYEQRGKRVLVEQCNALDI